MPTPLRDENALVPSSRAPRRNFGCSLHRNPVTACPQLLCERRFRVDNAPEWRDLVHRYARFDLIPGCLGYRPQEKRRRYRAGRIRAIRFRKLATHLLNLTNLPWRYSGTKVIFHFNRA